jgi:SAM-dependent methyltransferase
VTSRLGDFTAQAEAYARSRPGYPADLVERLLKSCGVTRGDAVAEIGAGTGLFTRCLSGRGLRVSALEPNEAMRSRAEALDGVTFGSGTFEDTGLPPGSQRWAVAAQAFHWADPRRSLPEMRRILVPRGHFTVLWNDRRNERSPVLARTQEAIRRFAPEFEEAYRGRDWGKVLVSTGDFEDIAADAAEHVVRMSRERYLGLWRSHNRLSVTAGPERLAALLGDIETYLDHAAIETVDVPYVCRSWTATAVR